MLRGFVVLVLCQFAGQVISDMLRLPLPGPLVGLLLLLALCAARGRVPEGVETASSALLGSFGLFFVPAGVGIVTQLGVIGGNWRAIAVALGASALLGLGVTAGVMRLLDRTPGELG